MAVTAAVHAQRALAAEDFGEVGGLRVRMAVHAGPVEARGQDYFGQGINRCARILSFSLGGQVLVSATVADMARGDLPDGTRFLDLGPHRLKDIAEPERIFQLVAPDLPADFPPIRWRSRTRARSTCRWSKPSARCGGARSWSTTMPTPATCSAGPCRATAGGPRSLPRASSRTTSRAAIAPT